MSGKRFIADPSPWVPIRDPRTLKVLGKFAEELFVCAEAAQRYDPYWTPSAENLQREIADVLCNFELVREHLGLPIMTSVAAFAEMTAISALALTLSRTGQVVARCIIQGIDEAEPSTGGVNRAWLAAEMSALHRALNRVIVTAVLHREQIEARVEMKREHLLRWHRMEAQA